MLVKAPDRLPNGDTAYEVTGSDIPGYFDVPFWLAVRFWKRYKHFGVPNSDWRRLTVQQMTVMTLFDRLDDLRQESVHGSH